MQQSQIDQYEQFDAFSSLKALRNMKKDLNQKKDTQVKPAKTNIKESLLYMEKKQPISTQELRTQFQSKLSKLIDLNTKEQSLRECRKLIQQTVSESSLQMMISCLSVPQILQANDGIVKVVQAIVDIYETQINLQDLYKLLDVVMKYFKDQSLQVQAACAEFWSVTYSIFASKLALQQKSLIFFQTLAGIISGGTNRQEQETSLLVLDKLYDQANIHNDIPFIKDSLKTFISIFLRCKVMHASLYYCLERILVTCTIHEFNNQQIQIVDKCLGACADIKINYRVRIASLSVLKVIGQQYQNLQFPLLGSYHDSVIQTLEDQTKDRIIAIQNSSRIALKEWAKVRIQLNQIDQKKQQRISNVQGQDFNEIMSLQNKNKVLYLIQHLNKVQVAQKPIILENDQFRNQVNTQTNVQFTKKRSGTGGGHLAFKVDNPGKPSENQHNKYIRDQIFNSNVYQGQQEIKNIKPNNFLIEEQKYDDLDDTVQYDQLNQHNWDETLVHITEKQNIVLKDSPKNVMIGFEDDGVQTNTIDNENYIEKIDYYLQLGNYEEGVNYFLDQGDDIYLIRLMVMSQDLFNKITSKTAVRLVSRLTLVLQSDFLNRICLEFLQDFIDTGVGNMIKDDDFIEFLSYMGENEDISGKQAKHISNQLKAI